MPFIRSDLEIDDEARPVAETERSKQARRAVNRLRALAFVGISYILDAAILWIYAFAGTIPAELPLQFLACGLAATSLFGAIFKFGVNERFKDSHLTLQQCFSSVLIMLGFAYIAPQVGFLFLAILFNIFAFSSLRATRAQTVAMWIATSCGLAALFLLTDTPVAIPHATVLERVATTIAFALAIGRNMFVGDFDSSLRRSLHKKGVELQSAYRRIEELAEIDELTGAFNRRSIMRMLANEISRAKRFAKPLSIALIDLDWFKNINDVHGHLVGDEVLRGFAITIFANVREIDRFGRYGGEEFLLIMPEVGVDDAALIVDRLRRILCDADFNSFANQLKITMSAGVADLRTNDTPEVALARADAALYEAKHRGRNQVVTTGATFAPENLSVEKLPDSPPIAPGQSHDVGRPHNEPA